MTVFLSRGVHNPPQEIRDQQVCGNSQFTLLLPASVFRKTHPDPAPCRIHTHTETNWKSRVLATSARLRPTSPGRSALSTFFAEAVEVTAFQSVNILNSYVLSQDQLTLSWHHTGPNNLAKSSSTVSNPFESRTVFTTYRCLPCPSTDSEFVKAPCSSLVS